MSRQEAFRIECLNLGQFLAVAEIPDNDLGIRQWLFAKVELSEMAGHIWDGDECRNFGELIPVLAEVEEAFLLRILLTSRISVEIQKYLQPLCSVLEDTKLYVPSNTNELQCQDAAARQDLINKV